MMTSRISFQPIEILTASDDREGRLVLFDGKLVAILVRLDDASHDLILNGVWFLETGLGLLDRHHELFASLDEAAVSIADWLT